MWTFLVQAVIKTIPRRRFKGALFAVDAYIYGVLAKFSDQATFDEVGDDWRAGSSKVSRVLWWLEGAVKLPCQTVMLLPLLPFQVNVKHYSCFRSRISSLRVTKLWDRVLLLMSPPYKASKGTSLGSRNTKPLFKISSRTDRNGLFLILLYRFTVS